MFSFSGHLREEEDRTVTGTNWTSDGYECPYPCIAGQTATLGSPSRPKQGIVSRRIDMAAMINENHADATELPDELIDLEATDNTQETKADDSDESDLKSTSSEKTVFFCGPFFCSPCVCRLWCLGFTLFALFVIGLGVGLRQRDEPTNKTSASALNSGVSVSMPGDDPPSLAPQQEQQGDQQQQQQGDQQNPTSYPTPSFDFDFEIDYDDAIVNEDSTGVTQEWDTSSSPYLVGVYYYPWHGKSRLPLSDLPS